MLRTLFASGLAFSVLGIGGSAVLANPTIGSDGTRAVSRSYATGPRCDRREVDECQDTARSRAIMCDAFSDRLACADTVLRAQSACLRETRCY